MTKDRSLFLLLQLLFLPSISILPLVYLLELSDESTAYRLASKIGILGKVKERLILYVNDDNAACSNSLYVCCEALTVRGVEEGVKVSHLQERSC